MRLLSLASHFPSSFFSQAECLEEMRKAPVWGDLRDRSRRILDKVFGADTGIEKRHFAEGDLAAVWGRSAQELNAHYEQAAPEMGQAALRKALNNANLTAADIECCWCRVAPVIFAQSFQLCGGASWMQAFGPHARHHRARVWSGHL